MSLRHDIAKLSNATPELSMNSCRPLPPILAEGSGSPVGVTLGVSSYFIN